MQLVAETKKITKIFQHTRSNLSLRRVAATWCCNLSSNLYTRIELWSLCVAANFRLVCFLRLVDKYFLIARSGNLDCDDDNDNDVDDSDGGVVMMTMTVLMI